jgi:hypothetical protein
MITDGLPGLTEIRAGEMISDLGQIVVTRRYLGRKNCFGHKLQPATACYLCELQPKAALIV